MRPTPLPTRLTADERQAHAGFIAQMGDGALWLNYQTLDIAAE
jgi:DNA polymerase-3 subunit epsilon